MNTSNNPKVDRSPETAVEQMIADALAASAEDSPLRAEAREAVRERVAARYAKVPDEMRAPWPTRTKVTRSDAYDVDDLRLFADGVVGAADRTLDAFIADCTSVGRPFAMPELSLTREAYVLTVTVSAFVSEFGAAVRDAADRKPATGEDAVDWFDKELLAAMTGRAKAAGWKTDVKPGE